MTVYRRRDVLQRLTTLSVLAALPASALAEILSAEPPVTGFGKESTAEEVTEGLDLSGKTYAITGANSGLGFETMRVLTMRGAHVIAIARSREKAEQACAAVEGETTPAVLDLAEFDTCMGAAVQLERERSREEGESRLEAGTIYSIFGEQHRFVATVGKFFPGFLAFARGRAETCARKYSHGESDDERRERGVV